MAGRDDLVRQRWRDLLPTAYLLTGDRAGARDLVVRALRRRPADRDTALDALVRAFLGRRLAGRGSVDGLEDPWWMSSDASAAAHQLADALDQLDLHDRVAVVLTAAESWSVERLRAAGVRADPEEAAGRLHAAVADKADLPRRLDSLAGLCAADTWDDDQVTAAVRAAAGRRARRVVLAVGAVAAVGAAAVWLPDPESTREVAGPAATATPRASAVLSGLAAEPARGELAQDAGVVAGLQERVAESDLPSGDYLPLYADDVRGVRVALLAGASAPSRLVWLVGDAGADPARLRVLTTADRSDVPAAAVTVTDPDGGADRLVVVAVDGAEVSASTGVDVDPGSGGTARSSVAVPLAAGVGSVVLDRPTSSGLRLQVLPPGGSTTEIWPASDHGDVYADVLAGPARPARSGAPEASGEGVHAALSAITGPTGWREEDVAVSVLGAGTVPAADGTPVEVVAVAAVLPSGAVATSVGTYWSVTGADGSTSASWGSCGTSTYPAGADPAGLVVGATCLVSGPDGDAAVRATVVFAPSGTEVALDTGAGDAAVTPELVDGFGYTTEVRRQDFRTATTTDGAVYPVAGPGDDALQW